MNNYCTAVQPVRYTIVISGENSRQSQPMKSINSVQIRNDKIPHTGKTITAAVVMVRASRDQPITIHQ